MAAKTTAKRPTNLELQKEIGKLSRKIVLANGDRPLMKDMAAFWRTNGEQFKALAAVTPGLIELVQSEDMKRFRAALPSVVAEIEENRRAEIGREYVRAQVHRVLHPFAPVGRGVWAIALLFLAAVAWFWVQAQGWFWSASSHPSHHP